MLVKEDTCMKCYDVRKPLHLENYMPDLGLGTALLQVRDNLNCGYDEAQKNAMFWPIAFASKSLSSVDQ